MTPIRIERAATLKPKPTDENNLGFGSIFTDHMLLINYDEGQGWHDARIVPYGPIALDPAAMCLHYGQSVFEGMKAYRHGDDILLFRPDENFKRLNNSNDRLCIPKMDEQLLMDSLVELLKVEKDWIPHAQGASLYIRPFILATEAKLGVKPSDSYLYLVILSPSGNYYPEGLNPVKIYVETEYVRAVKGGTGTAKTPGNYAASLKAQDIAHKLNYTQVLWLDGVHRKYIEEVGTMNVFFMLGDTVVTPVLDGSVLPGITRKSTIELLQEWGIKVEERKLSLEEVMEAGRNGQLVEAFGTGTAAVISPIGELHCGKEEVVINGGKIGPITHKLYDTLTGIQWGNIEGPKGWSVRI